MRKYVCSVCGYVYDEAKGLPEAGIAPGTRWEALAADWVCPLCGATKAEFKEIGAPEAVIKPAAVPDAAEELQELSPLETSALCSNLARGCEKQYKAPEAALFTELAAYFKSSAPSAEQPKTGALLALIEQDLNAGFPAANAVSSDAKDRGALRSLVWSEKVTRILKSLLTRYEKEGDAMLENTGVYVCTICGFVYVGDRAPELCPVCKVPSWKFEKIEGRAQ
ncbi:MAG: rubredoxin [Oscillospiraceae bacterium]